MIRQSQVFGEIATRKISSLYSSNNSSRRSILLVCLGIGIASSGFALVVLVIIIVGELIMTNLSMNFLEEQ